MTSGPVFAAARNAPYPADTILVLTTETAAVLTCANCHTQNEPGRNFCTERMTDDQPVTVATRQIGETFMALLEGRWIDGRHGFLVAVRTLEPTHYRRLLANVRMAVGHLARDRFPEAAEALREADSFFTDRGAATIVSGYVASAATAPLSEGAVAPSSGPVRTQDVPVS